MYCRYLVEEIPQTTPCFITFIRRNATLRVARIFLPFSYICLFACASHEEWFSTKKTQIAFSTLRNIYIYIKKRKALVAFFPFPFRHLVPSCGNTFMNDDDEVEIRFPFLGNFSIDYMCRVWYVRSGGLVRAPAGPFPLGRRQQTNTMTYFSCQQEGKSRRQKKNNYEKEGAEKWSRSPSLPRFHRERKREIERQKESGWPFRLSHRLPADAFFVQGTFVQYCPWPPTSPSGDEMSKGKKENIDQKYRSTIKRGQGR